MTAAQAVQAVAAEAVTQPEALAAVLQVGALQAADLTAEVHQAAAAAAVPIAEALQAAAVVPIAEVLQAAAVAAEAHPAAEAAAAEAAAIVDRYLT